MISLRPQQQRAYDAWLESGCNGIIKSPTGTGKTWVALKAIESNPENIIIVVPTIPLQQQWSEHLNRMGIEHGLLGNGSKEMKSVTIAVINSLREVKTSCRLLIVDEVHRILSEENFKILENIEYTSFLGLSATPEREDNNFWNILSKKHPVVSEYTLEDALEEKQVCEFQIERVACYFSKEEEDEYNKATHTIKSILPMYGYSLNIALSALKAQGSTKASELVCAIQLRRKIVSSSLSKIQKAAQIINENPDKKIIVFAESIEVLDEILPLVHRRAWKYHSQMGKKERKEVLNQFRESANGVLLSARCLDEGIDVPDCDTAIMVAGSSSKRQFIQRLGRILRPKDSVAVLYELYIPNTVEEKWLTKRKSK